MSPSRFGDTPSAWWPVLLALGLFLLARPYEGIVHDARLYVGYAIAPLDPAGIGTDILFQFDRQGSRSLFPVVLRSLIEVSSPSIAALGITWLTVLLWFCALWRFVKQLWPSLRDTEVAMLVVIAGTLHSWYGGSSVFRYAEPFASPRGLSEALVLFALGFGLRARWVPAGLIVLTAAVLHPLMAIVGMLLLVWCALPGERARWSAAAVAAGILAMQLLITALDVSTLSPFRRFDAAWYRVLDENGALVFLHNWEAIDWARIVVQGVTIGMAWPLVHGSSRVLMNGTLVAVAGGLLLTAVGADVLHSELLTQVQPWRALWLLAVLAPLALGYQLLCVVRSRGNGSGALYDYRVIALVVLGIAWFMISASDSAATLALLALLLWYVPVVRPSYAALGTIRSALVVLAPVLVVAVALSEGRVILQAFERSPGGEMLWYLPTAVLAGGVRLVGAGVACMLVWLSVSEREVSATATRVLLAATLLVLVAGVTLFDARTAYQRTIETNLDGKTDVARRVLPIATTQAGYVFWPDASMEAWAFLGRPGYASAIEGIPRVFSRPLALRWAARRASVAALQTVARAPRYRLELDRLMSDDPSGINGLCRAPDAPATVVLTRRPVWASAAREVVLPSPQLLMGQDPGEAWEVRNSVYLVNCNDIRVGVSS